MNLESLLERKDIPEDVMQAIRQHVIDVSEKKKLKKAVEESEERLRSFIDAATDPILLLDSNLNVTDINMVALNGMGLDRNTVIGKALSEISPYIKETGRYDKYLEVIKTGEPLLIKDLVPHPKFGDLHVELKAFKVGDGLGLVTRDITENKQAEEKLQENEQKFRLLSEQSILGIVILQDGVIKYVNNALTQIIQYTPEEMMKWSSNEFLKAIHPEDRQFALEQAQRKQLGEIDIVLRYKYRLLTKLGKIKWVESFSKTIMYDGKPADFINIMDVTDRIEAEEALKESEERFRLFFELAPISTAIASLEGRSFTVNYKTFEIFGFSEEELKTIDLEDTYANPEDRKKILEELISSGSLKDREVKRKRKDGSEFDAILDARIIEKGGEKFILSTMQDITQQKEAEVQLQKSEERYRMLFNESPISLWEEDGSEVKQYIDELRTKGIVDFQQYLDKYPDEVFKMANMVKIIDVNNTTLKMFKAKRKEDLLQNLTTVFGEESFVAFKGMILALAEGETFFETEGVNYTLTGEKIQALLRLNVVLGFDETSSRVLISIIDITDRILMEKALRESEMQYRTLFENIPIGLYRSTKDHKILAANPTFLNQLGISSFEELCAIDTDKLATQQKYPRDRFKKEIEEKGEVKGLEFHLTLDDGSITYHRENARLIKDSDGAILYYEGSVEDITDRVQAETALRESEERLRAFMNSATDYFSLWDSNLNLIDLNRVAKDILKKGAIKKELIGKNLSEFEPFRERDVYYNFMRVIKTGKPYFVYDYVFQRESYDNIHLAIKAFKVGEGMGMIVTDITQRNKAEEALRDSRDKYQMLIEKLEEGVILTDANGIITFMNPGVMKIFGYSEEEIIGKHWSFTSPPEDLKKYKDEAAKRPKGISSTYESGILSKNGKRIPVIVSATPLKSPDGDYIGTLSVFRDVSEQKEAELKLRESEEKFRTLSEQNILGITILQDGLVKYVNDACTSITGYPPEEMMNWAPDEFGKYIHPQDRSFVMEQARKKQLGQDDVIKHYSYRIITKTGETKWIENYSKTIMFEGKTADLVTIIDITERKKTEEALKESEQRYRTLITSMSDGIIVNDLDNKIMLVNPVIEKMIGYNKEEMQNRSVIEFLDPDSISIYKAKTDERHSGKFPSDEYELVFVRKDGIKITTRIAASVLEEGSQITGSFALISDITTKRELEDRRSSFMSMTAHELRTPTTIIKGYAELLETYIRELSLEEIDKFVNPLQRINKNVQRLERLITDVRNIMKIERGIFQIQSETVLFNEFLDEFLGSYKVILKDQLEYTISFPEITIECDPARLLQVLGNIMRNAIDNTPKDTRKITVVSNITSKEIIIRISDNGAGIEPENLQKIFEPFVSVPTEFTVQGTGVGLYLSRSIVEAHGGSLSAFSKGKGFGATFTVKLPK